MADSKQNGRDNGGDVERYKQAANDVLQQLDLGIGFCIGFLAGGNKGEFAERLARNGADIREEFMELDKQPLSSRKT
jgi:hypothetical protein